MQSDMAWWVLGFISIWEETDLSLCSLYAGDGHLWKNFGATPSWSHNRITTPHAFSCRRWNCHIQVGTQVHKDWLGYNLKDNMKSRTETWAWTLCLNCAVSDSSIAKVQDSILKGEWFAKSKEVQGQEGMTRVPSWFRMPCSPCCTSYWEAALVVQKSTWGLALLAG